MKGTERTAILLLCRLRLAAARRLLDNVYYTYYPAVLKITMKWEKAKLNVTLRTKSPKALQVNLIKWSHFK